MDYNATYSLLIRYLDGETTADESAMVEDLLRTDESWQKEFEVLKALNLEIERSCEVKAETNQCWENLKGRLNTSLPLKTKNYWRSYSKYAAAAAIILLAGLYFLKPFSNTAFEQGITYTTGENQSKIINLIDGSRIVLGENSSFVLDKDFNRSNRIIQLKGLAYFDVKGNAQKPFIAIAQNTRTKVIGTSFEINTQLPYTLNVQLFKGKIEFISAQNAITLQPGQQLFYNLTSKKISTQSVDISKRKAYTVTGLDFKDAPLAEIIQKLEQTYGITIEIPAAMQNEHYTISFDGLDLSASLRLLEELTDSKITKKGSNYLLKP